MDDKEEYTQEYLEKQSAAKQWIEELVEEQIGDDLSESLRDGIVLCRLISVLCPTIEISVITSTPHKYRIMENISAFLDACTRLGFTYTELFVPPDLFEKRNMNKVLDTLKKIADYAATYDFPKWKGSTAQFSRTERKSIIGGDASKALPPRGSMPPKKSVLPSSTPNPIVRTLPLFPLATNAGIKTAARLSSHSASSVSPSLRASEQPITAKEIPKPSQRTQLTSSKEQQRREGDVSTDKVTPKPTGPAPSWDGLLSSSDRVNTGDEKPKYSVQEKTPREEIIFLRDEISLSLPRSTAESASKSPTSTTQATPVKISHQKSNSSSNLVLPQTTSHSRSKSNTVSLPVPNPALSTDSTNPANASAARMTTFQRVQQSLFLDEDIQNSGIRRSQPSDGSSLSRYSDSSHKQRPASVTQPLQATDVPPSMRSPDPKDAEEKPAKHSTELRKEDRLSKRSSELSPEQRAIRSDKSRSERQSGNYSDTLRRSSDRIRSERSGHRSDHDRPEHRSDRDDRSDRSDRRDDRSDRLDRHSRSDRDDKSDRLDRANRSDRDDRSDRSDAKIERRSLEISSSEQESKVVQDLAAQLRQSSDAQERDALQRKISLLVSDARLAEYLSQLPRGKESSNPASSPSLAYSSPSSPSSPSVASESSKQKHSSDASPLALSPFLPSSDPALDLKHQRPRRENRHSLPPNSLGTFGRPPPVPVSSSSSVSPSASLSSTDNDSSTDVSTTSSSAYAQRKSSKRNKRHSLAFPPPLPPLISSMKDGRRGSPSPDSSHILSESDSSSSASSFSRRPHAATTSSLSSSAYLPNTSKSPTTSPPLSQPRRASPQSLPTRGASPKTRTPISSDTFSPDRTNTEPASTPSSKSKFNTFSRITNILTQRDEDTIEMQVQRLDELLRSCTDGSSMLHLAARHNYIKVVGFLLQCGEDPNSRDKLGKTPLHVAAALGNRDIIDLLLKAGAQINTTDANGATPLQRAAEHNQNSAVSKIVAVPGVKIDTLRNQDGWTPLYTSSHQGNYDNVSMLLTYHADPNVKNSEGWTALHAACHQGHYKVVKLLVKAGANLNVLSNQGTTPIFHAIEQDQFEIGKLLGELGANIDLSKNFGWKPIHMAVYKGAHESTSWLVAKGAKLNEIVRDANLKGYTPLHILVSSDWLSESSKKNLELLLKAGAGMRIRDDSGATPLHLAAYWDNVDAVKIIIKHFHEDDIIYDVRDNNDETAADIAAYYGNLQVLKLLPRYSTKVVTNNPQTTGKMLPPLPPPLPPAPLLALATPHGDVKR